MTPLPEDLKFAYLKGNLPAHLSDWAAYAGIELRSTVKHALYDLSYEQGRLQLNWFGEENFSPVSVQVPAQIRNSSGNLLIRALGKNTRVVADLTTGMGVDAFTVAATGRQVYCIERCAPIALLLFDGISRCPPVLANAMSLAFCDSKSWLSQHSGKLDAIYIDTMFTDKKKSVKSSKQMQILRALAGEDQDAQTLVDAALNQTVSRVILKKSANAAQPSVSTIAQYRGKTIRFDVYRPQQKT